MSQNTEGIEVRVSNTKPESIGEDLISLRDGLLGVVANITQTPSQKVTQARLASNIAAAKIAGATTSASLFAIVSTFGTAGTGTAIGSLSGAAATSATLAWFGKLIGGGAATGAMLLPVVGVGVGAAVAYGVRNLLFDKPRKLAELTPEEQRILFCADAMLHSIEDVLQNSSAVSTDELALLNYDGILPLTRQLESYCESFGLVGGPDLSKKFQANLASDLELIKNFSAKYPFAHTIRKKGIFSRIRSWFLKRNKRSAKNRDTEHIAGVVIATTFVQLLDRNLSSFSLEQSLVLDALRRSKGSLANASTTELSYYIKSLEPEQLKGVISNTKGIYHELLFVENFNFGDGEVQAKLMEELNHPGSDVQFISERGVISEVQLKAVDSPTQVYEHLQRYPDIDVLATEEVASVLDGVDSSGLNNAVLQAEVIERLHELEGMGFISEVTGTLATSVLVNSGILIFRVLQNPNVGSDDFKRYLANAGIAVGTTTIVGGALSVIGN